MQSCHSDPRMQKNCRECPCPLNPRSSLGTHSTLLKRFRRLLRKKKQASLTYALLTDREIHDGGVITSLLACDISRNYRLSPSPKSFQGVCAPGIRKRQRAIIDDRKNGCGWQ